MLIMCLLTWTGQFIGLGLHVDNLPAVAGGGFNQLGVLVSNTLLNYAFVVTVLLPTPNNNTAFVYKKPLLRRCRPG